MPSRKTKTKPDQLAPAVQEPLADGLLRNAVQDMTAIMQRVIQLSQGEINLADLLDVLEGISEASTRLATLLRAERELAEGNTFDQELRQAVAGLFIPDAEQAAKVEDTRLRDTSRDPQAGGA